MAGRKKTRKPVEARDLQGFKYFRLAADLFDGLHDAGTLRDKAGNRNLFFDQYALLMLLYYSDPVLDSLRGLQQATQLEKVQKLLGVRQTSLGSLSEAAGVFDAALLEPVVAELARQALARQASLPKAHEAALAGLTAVDGSLLRALPRMAWAVWQDDAHRAAKMHVAFAVFEGVPTKVALTAGNASERAQWRATAEPGGFYVVDRGYLDYGLFRDLDADGCRFVARLRENSAYEAEQADAERPLTSADRAAGVVRDVTTRRLGTAAQHPLLERPMRVVTVEGPQPGQVWVLLTNDLGLPAELVALAYRYRWQVELFFRWLKCVLGCRHLLSHSRNGVTTQVYLAIIASLLISLWTGSKPTKRTYEMLCHYLAGWATAAEVGRHLQDVAEQEKPP
jgi:hypothetical protein